MTNPMKRTIDSVKSTEKSLLRRKKSLLLERQKLVIWRHRSALTKCISENETVIIISSTGSGKTTQVPQFLLEEGINRKLRIAVTQPRRVAAMSIAERVAAEMGTQLGERVGYKVRFEDSCGPQTVLKYLTDGSLLREALTDPLLRDYSVVVLDEAHERTLQTDLLFGVLKECRRRRLEAKMKALKVVIMSATIDPEDFEVFWGREHTRVVYLEGRQHPLECRSITAPVKDHVEAAISAVQTAHLGPEQGDILCFLAGRDEIERAARVTADALAPANRPPDRVSALQALVVRLYAGLPTGAQMKALAPTPAGFRKIIFSTNIAETSITIPGVRIVLDSGYCKIRSRHASTSIETLLLHRISKAQAWQRAGRAGREGPGVCMRLFTDSEYAAFAMQQQPELQRVSLAATCLQVLKMGYDPDTFPFLSLPAPKAREEAMRQLRSLGAVKTNEKAKSGFKVTKVGHQMTQFPVEPQIARAIIAACTPDLHCSAEVLSVVAMLSVDHLFFEPGQKQEKYESARRRFDSPLGDFISLLRIFRDYKSQMSSRNVQQWCRQNCVNARALKFAMRVRCQLRDVCAVLQLPVVSCGQKLANVNRAFLTGLCENAARLVRMVPDGSICRDYTSMLHGGSLHLHPDSSVFHGHPPSHVVFAECVFTNKAYMRCVCPIDPTWPRELAPQLFAETS